MSEREALLALVVAARARLAWLRQNGVDHLDATCSLPQGTDSVSVEQVPGRAMPPLAPTPPAVVPSEAPSDRSATDAAVCDLFVSPEIRQATSLPSLRTAIGDCQRCKLAPHRTHLVFGVGNPKADLVFVGEAPGRDEDLKGEPFVGRAGQLLTEIIVKGMKLQREDVYIANIIKCRPPQNRNPEPDEIAACEPFLVRQLELLRPRVIVALGTFAAQALLRTRTPITRMRGVWTEYRGIPLMPTFHPAYLLRNPAEKRLVWQDIQQVMATLGLTR